MIKLSHPCESTLQATYVPAENGIAWWGVADVPALLKAAQLPPGRPVTLRLASVVDDQVQPVDVSTYVSELAITASALAATPHTRQLAESARRWRDASRAVLEGAGAIPARSAALERVIATLPPAGCAVLNPQESAIMAPPVAVRKFVAALETDLALHRGGLVADLRPYQAQGISWLCERAAQGQGALLADEMGLGKTVQAIGLLTTRTARLPHLVVCPTSLLGNWSREIARFAPHVRTVRHHGSGRGGSADTPAGTVVITSYPLLRADESLQNQEWDVVLFDEAQQLKNPSAMVSKAARSLTANIRIALTGTPVENNLDELWSIISLTNPGILGTRARFRQRFVTPIQQRRSKTAAAALSQLVTPHMLRRTKSEVASDLPPRLNSTVVCTLSEEQVMLYRLVIDRAFGDGLGSGIGRRGRILALLTELKQICNHPAQLLDDGDVSRGRSGKFDRASEMLAEIVDDGERALVFTQYRRMGDLLSSGIGAALGTGPVPFLHGGLEVGQREVIVDSFQEDQHASPVLVLSLRAAGFGLNLTRASHVLHFDRWWNPAVEEQATARAHRIGQQRTLSVHTLITAGTVEEHIDRMHQEKRGLAEIVTDDPLVALTNLPDHQLREMLDLNLAEVYA